MADECGEWGISQVKKAKQKKTDRTKTKNRKGPLTPLLYRGLQPPPFTGLSSPSYTRGLLQPPIKPSSSRLPLPGRPRPNMKPLPQPFRQPRSPGPLLPLSLIHI